MSQTHSLTHPLPGRLAFLLLEFDEGAISDGRSNENLGIGGWFESYVFLQS